MRKISSGTTFFSKRVFPVMWFGFLAFFVVSAGFIGGNKFHPEMFIPPVFMAIIGFIVMKKLVFGLMDEVWDDGDALVVRNSGMESRIPLTNIINVSSSTFTNPPRITLMLREPCAFGKEITFSPPRKFLGFNFASMHPVALDLIRRIDEKRNRG